jgi:hypothetical protein
MVKESNQDTYDNREFASNAEAIVHIALVYILLHLQVVAILNLTLHSFSVGEQRYYLIAVRVTSNFDHDKVSEVASEAAEDGVVREEDSLVLSFLIGYFNA